MRCPKCGNPWSTNNDQWGNVWCQKEPPYHYGCGKHFRLKRTGGLRRRAKRDDDSITRADKQPST